MNGRARHFRCAYSVLTRLCTYVLPDLPATSVARPRILPQYWLACPITGSRPVKSLCHHDRRAQLIVSGVDLAHFLRRRADGRESFARRLAACACATARMHGRRRRAARPDATREGWAMRRRGINRRPGGAAAAVREQFGGVAVAAGTRRDVRGTWGGRGSNGDAIRGHRGQ